MTGYIGQALLPHTLLIVLSCLIQDAKAHRLIISVPAATFHIKRKTDPAMQHHPRRVTLLAPAICVHRRQYSELWGIDKVLQPMGMLRYPVMNQKG